MTTRNHRLKNIQTLTHRVPFSKSEYRSHDGNKCARLIFCNAKTNDCSCLHFFFSVWLADCFFFVASLPFILFLWFFFYNDEYCVPHHYHFEHKFVRRVCVCVLCTMQMIEKIYRGNSMENVKKKTDALYFGFQYNAALKPVSFFFIPLYYFIFFFIST